MKTSCSWPDVRGSLMTYGPCGCPASDICITVVLSIGYQRKLTNFVGWHKILIRFTARKIFHVSVFLLALTGKTCRVVTAGCMQKVRFQAISRTRLTYVADLIVLQNRAFQRVTPGKAVIYGNAVSTLKYAIVRNRSSSQLLECHWEC